MQSPLPLATFQQRSFVKPFVEIHQIEFVGRTGQRRIEPAQHVARHRLVAEQTTVDENGTPLAALRLVAGNGIGKLYLNGIKMRVLTNFLKAFNLALNIEVVLFHLAKESVALLPGQRRGLRGNGIEQDLALQLGVVIVSEGQHSGSKAEAVKIRNASSGAVWLYRRWPENSSDNLRCAP